MKESIIADDGKVITCSFQIQIGDTITSKRGWLMFSPISTVRYRIFKAIVLGDNTFRAIKKVVDDG